MILAALTLLTLDLDRYMTLVEVAPTVCERVISMPGEGSKNLQILVPNLPPEERLVLINLCATYIKGKISGLSK